MGDMGTEREGKEKVFEFINSVFFFSRIIFYLNLTIFSEDKVGGNKPVR